MPRSYITRDDMYRKLLKFVKQQGSQYKAAASIGIGQSFLNSVILRRRPMGTKIPLALGYRAVMVYEELKKNSS